MAVLGGVVHPSNVPILITVEKVARRKGGEVGRKRKLLFSTEGRTQRAVVEGADSDDVGTEARNYDFRYCAMTTA
ncbi:hypothetical protein EVAR_94882_1 [Eumeta japonica]|uniref:Uncharacterized protein n=1 Tax=Eumeta variegata TaxID=151549 RepID=A0A4C1V9D6_EUMVA|nr:hypothetical protein EVAR_94882_1 [Eumeta japonica]